jgi:collagenase-like PrtC family protease
MRLVVGTNFDDSLLEELRKFPVKYIFGSETVTVTGHGRASFVLPKVDEERLKQHASIARSYGIKFLYTMNTATLQGREYSSSFMDKVKRQIDSHANIVDGFIVAMPLLISYIRKEYPDIEISVSSYSRVYNVREAEEYISMGVNTIIAHEDVNRNFKVLKAMRSLADVEVITNNSCLWGCPYRRTHDLISSMTSNQQGEKGIWFEYPIMFCATDVRNDLANLIRMRWIRPEDLTYYEEIGIDRFKIAGRNKSTPWIVRTVKAYSERKYEGNLLDIVSYPQGRALPKVMRKIGGPSYYDVLEKVTIDNSQFPERWLNFFKYNDCESKSCVQCKYCDIIAERVLKVDGESPGKMERLSPPIELIPRFEHED